MEWWEFLEGYEGWSASTQRIKMGLLREMGTGEEVTIVVRHMQEPRNKVLLIRKAMYYGVRFSPAQIQALERELPTEVGVQLREYAGQSKW